MKARNEDVTPYHIHNDLNETDQDDLVIAEALRLIKARLKETGLALNSPQVVKDYLTLTLAGLEHEEFHCLFLNTQNRLIQHDRTFRGTLTQTSVYPREIVKLALTCNANAVIFTHNHPSGLCEPSKTDETLTTGLKTALALIDVRVLDHIIVAGTTTLSFAERGLL